MGPWSHRNREGVVRGRGEHLWPLHSELEAGSALCGSWGLHLQPKLTDSVQ